MKFNKYTVTAIAAAKSGGNVLLKYFNSGLKVSYKGRIDPVTAADKASQRSITKLIKSKFPSHTVIGEEGKNRALCSDYCWIVDPLDGTVNFIHGVPFFSVSISLLKKGKVIAGAIYAPWSKELFAAQKGGGAYLNGRKIKVSSHRELVRSLVVTGFPYDIHSGSGKVLQSLSNVIVKVQGVRRLGSAALDLAYVAAGRFEAFWEKGLKPWDIAAGSLILEEAGGKISEFDGGNNYIFGDTLLASNGLIHYKMVKLINS